VKTQTLLQPHSGTPRHLDQSARVSHDSGAKLEATHCQPFPWLIVPMLLLIAARYFFATTDVDYWWHIRTGQLIVETGTLLRVDLFSYTYLPASG
jgi:hypothetical protein